MLPGNWVAGGPTRTTTPCSWSVDTSNGMPEGCDIALSWIPFDKPAI
jgi:hypothetical protein